MCLDGTKVFDVKDRDWRLFRKNLISQYGEDSAKRTWDDGCWAHEIGKVEPVSLKSHKEVVYLFFFFSKRPHNESTVVRSQREIGGGGGVATTESSRLLWIEAKNVVEVTFFRLFSGCVRGFGVCV